MRYEERKQKRESANHLAQRRKKRNRLFCIMAVFLFLFTVAGVKIYQHNKANIPYVTVGNTNLTEPQYYYFYNMMVNNFQSEYEDYLPYMDIDFEKDLSKQMLTEDESWDEYFMVNTDMALYEMLLLYNEAKEKGYEQDAIKESVQQAVDGLEMYIDSSSMSTEQYIRYAFHEDLDMKKFKECMEIYITANRYSNEIINGFEISEEDYADYYKKNTEKLDLVSYYQIAVKEKDYKASKEKAEEMLSEIEKEKTKEAFLVQSVEYQGNNGYQQNTFSKIGTAAEWLMSAENDSYKLIEDEGNEQVLLVYKEDRQKNDTLTVNMRHILISIPEDATDETSYYKKIQEIEQEFQTNGGTEEAFSALVAQYTEDTASAENGGLYENISQDEMDNVIDAWLFMDTRKEGDTAILRSSYGFHLVYFAGNGIEAYKKDSRESILNEKLDIYMKDLKERDLYVKKKG